MYYLCQSFRVQGSSRASILGEAIINLADYADALKPSVVALPLHGCNHGTILHVRNVTCPIQTQAWEIFKRPMETKS